MIKRLRETGALFFCKAVYQFSDGGFFVVLHKPICLNNPLNQIIIRHVDLLHDFEELLVLVPLDMGLSFPGTQPELGDVKFPADIGNGAVAWVRFAQA